MYIELTFEKKERGEKIFFSRYLNGRKHKELGLKDRFALLFVNELLV